MKGRVPILPTLIVLIAAAIMIRLGFWQLDRLHQKEAMLARFAAAAGQAAEVSWPGVAAVRENAMYRRSRLDCRPSGQDMPLSGRNLQGEAGWSHEIACQLPEGSQAHLVLGWSSDPARRTWAGGTVTGIIGPRGKDDVRLVADPPLAGLQPNARPDPRDIPNNHLSYAVQWFLFAGVALVIYVLALRKRLRG